MLSSIGAALAGLGVGVYLASPLARAAPFILAVGLIAHLYGMVGSRRMLGESGRCSGSVGASGLLGLLDFSFLIFAILPASSPRVPRCRLG